MAQDDQLRDEYAAKAVAVADATLSSAAPSMNRGQQTFLPTVIDAVDSEIFDNFPECDVIYAGVESHDGANSLEDLLAVAQDEVDNVAAEYEVAQQIQEMAGEAGGGSGFGSALGGVGAVISVAGAIVSAAVSVGGGFDGPGHGGGYDGSSGGDSTGY